jgi:hypothetical protein
MVRSLNRFLNETVLSKRLHSKLLSPGIQIALSQQGRGITCKFCPSVAIITYEAGSATFSEGLSLLDIKPKPIRIRIWNP